MASNEQVNIQVQATMDPPSLIALPAEVLMKVAQQLPQSSLNTLAQTCSKVGELVKLHGAIICNERVASHYPEAIKIFKIKKNASGWYLPTSESLLEADRRVQDRVSSYNTLERTVNGRVVKIKSPRYIKDLRQIHLLAPGRQLCAFLNKYNQVIRAKHRQLVTKGGVTKADKTKGEEKFIQSVESHTILAAFEGESKGLGMSWDPESIFPFLYPV
ncbi:hypothetical protein BKA64DRAFT_703682 [Cadophora sp. MPI-SDFR-AT-0126]|nr:hypothetical protein BKA64DRAFT_703682 [Leotiomycetes sp. MPI-SDFR-AT-0126]